MKCMTCDRPVLINSAHTIVIDNDEFPFDSKVPEELRK